MGSYFYLTLDTTGVSNPSLIIENNATYISTQLANLTIGCGDESTQGYTMKIWGDVDTTYDSNIKITEADSSWITYTTSKQIKLSNGDGLKTIYLKIRDDVWNESAIVSATITLDTSVPVVTVTRSDVTRISKVNGKNIASFSFIVSEPFIEYRVKVVTSPSATHDTGVQIPTTNGSVNMSGTGIFNTVINCTINGADLELASSGDGNKIIKVFVKDASGKWSV